MDLKQTSKAITIGCSLLLVFTTLVSLCVGRYSLSIERIIDIIFSKASSIDANVFFKLRVPRTLMAIMAGAGLGLSGFVYQTIFKNPLASPDIVGISSGSNLGTAVMIVIFGGSLSGIAVGAFVGGLVAMLCVLGLVKSTRSNSTSTYVLSGIIISAVANALIMLLKYCADSEGDLATIDYWTMGSFSAITLSKVVNILPFWIIGFVCTMLLSRQVSLLNLNEDEARGLGVNVKLIRIMVLGFSTLLVSSIICVTGLISFAGLISPHIVSLMIKRHDSKTMILSSIVGAEILLVSDILCRTFSSSELPISILTTIIGVPILVVIMIQKKRQNG